MAVWEFKNQTYNRRQETDKFYLRPLLADEGFVFINNKLLILLS